MIVYQISVKLKPLGFESYFNGFNLHYIEWNPEVYHHDIISVKLITDLLRFAKRILVLKAISAGSIYTVNK